MYRLTVIAGPTGVQPARGSSYAVNSGSFTIGRHSDNQIVLNSGNVSKRHCVLVVNNSGVAMEDQGSANGTFVNGKLAAKKALQLGDRISVGEFVFELNTGSESRALAGSYGTSNNVIPFRPNFGASSSTPAPAMSITDLDDVPMPKDIFGKLKYYFDKVVLPYFFGFNERYEWRIVIGSLFGLYLLLNLFISLSPLMNEQQRSLEREVSERANVMAREIADRNTGFMAAKAESKLELGSFERAHGVRVALIVDLENKILAPSTKAGRYFQVGSEAAAAVQARKLFLDGRSSGVISKSDSSTIVAIQPIQVFNPAAGKNTTAAMSVVSIDLTTATTEGAARWLVYSHTLVLSVIIGLLIFYLIYRVTIRPFQEMNRKIDQVLRGEHIEFKPSVFFSEVDPLWDVMDSALKRVPKGESANANVPGAGALGSHDFLGPLRAIASTSKHGTAILDEERKVLYINSIFEEITGVRLDSVEGQALGSVVRDQAFSGLVIDLCERASPGTEGITEDFDFSGIMFEIRVISFGHFGDPKCYFFNLVRKEE